MKRVLASLAALGLFVLVSPGCNSADDSTPKTSAAAPAKQQGDDWQIKLTTNCQSAAPEQCVAAYGFTVFSDGHFEAGP